MKFPKFLSPSKKENPIPNVIYIAVEEVSEELLIYILAINNKSFSTSVQNRESLKKRIRQIAKYKNDKIVIPCLVFSIQDEGKLINKLCPFSYSLDYPQKIENEDIHVYEYHTVRDHLERGILFKELDKMIKSKKEEHSDLIEFVTEIGKPIFKDKIETQIEKFSEGCNLGKNSLNRAPLKRSKADIVDFLYNYDSSQFNHCVSLCNYNPSNQFTPQMGTMVYHSTLEENQNNNEKTYVVNQNEPDNTTDTREISSALIIPTSEEETELIDNPPPETNLPTIAYQETYQENQNGEGTRSEAELIENSQIEKIPNNEMTVPSLNTHQNISDVPNNNTHNNPSESVNPKNAPVTNSQLSEILRKTLGPNPFQKPNNGQNNINNPSTDPDILKIKGMFASSCPENHETEKLLENTKLSDASLQRMHNAANLCNANNATRDLINLTDEPSLNTKENEKSRVGFDSLQNQIKYISTEDKDSSLKKPKFGDKSRSSKNPLKLPPSIVKRSKTKSDHSKLVKTEGYNDSSFQFNPNVNSTPYHGQKLVEPKVEESRILSNNYEYTTGDAINPGTCSHGSEIQTECKTCIAELMKFANDHHNDFVSSRKIKNENIAESKTVPINSVSKNRKPKTRKARKDKHHKHSSSSSESDDEKPKKPKSPLKSPLKNKKQKPSSGESSDSEDSIPDFESTRYSNVSLNSGKLKGLKFRNTLKYPKLTREAALDPNKYFDRFITTLQINIDGGNLENCEAHIVAHILAEQMLDNFEAQEEIFTNLASTAKSLKEVRNAFRKALAESVILREKRFEDISEKPKDLTWKSFASNLYIIFKNAFPLEKDPLNSKLLILKFKSLINKDLRKSYELSKVVGKEDNQNLFEIAEVLDKIASFSVLENEDKSVFSIQKEVTFNPKVESENHSNGEFSTQKNGYQNRKHNISNEAPPRNANTNANSDFTKSRNSRPQNNDRRPGYFGGQTHPNHYQNQRDFSYPQNFVGSQRNGNQNFRNARNYNQNFQNQNNFHPNHRQNHNYNNYPNNYGQPYMNGDGTYARGSNAYAERRQQYSYPRNYDNYNERNYFNPGPSRGGRINHKYRY